MDSVKSACCWLVGVLKAGYHTRSSTGISVMAALTFLGTVSVVPCGQWGFCTIENVPISPKPPWSNLGFFPSLSSPTRVQSPGHAGSILQLFWGFVSFTSYCMQPFPGWVVLCLTSCSGLDSTKETELYPQRHMLSLSQSFYIASRRKN